MTAFFFGAYSPTDSTQHVNGPAGPELRSPYPPEPFLSQKETSTWHEAYILITLERAGIGPVGITWISGTSTLCSGIMRYSGQCRYYVHSSSREVGPPLINSHTSITMKRERMSWKERFKVGKSKHTHSLILMVVLWDTCYR